MVRSSSVLSVYSVRESVNSVRELFSGLGQNHEVLWIGPRGVRRALCRTRPVVVRGTLPGG